MRRTALFAAAAVVALASGASASAELWPIKRDFGDRTLPLFRQGTLRIPAGQADGRVRVIVGLPLAPLATAQGRPLSRTGRHRLDVAGSPARGYLLRLERAQNTAVANLKRAIPSARVSRRYQVVLNGLAVDLPVRRLVDLARLSFVERIYPSVRFQLALNESPALIAAPALWAATGARGEGVKIAVIDDGVDESHPFFDPKGYTYPTGYPKGGRKWTTPRVIVARAFPGPGAGRRGRLPVDRNASFHGTHVAGIAAGKSGTTSPGGRTHRPTSNLSGVAPRAYIGNYRVFTIPTQVGHVGNTPELVAAFEAAVRDGMDVINLSGGSAETDPANDALVEAARNAAAAGVVPVIAAGNSRDEFGFGTVGSPGTAPEAITVGAVSNTHVFGPVVSVTDARAPANLKQLPFRVSVGSPAFQNWERADQTLADIGSITGSDGRPVDRKLCGVRSPESLDSTLPRNSLRGAIALVFRGGCPLITKAYRAVVVGGAVGIVMVDNRASEANRLPLDLGVPSGMVSDLDGAYLRDFLASVGGRAGVRFDFDPLEAKNGRSGVITSFSSAGPTAFGHRLKPDVAAPGGEILSSTLPEFAGSPFAPFDGTSMATPHVAGAAALLVQRHPGWSTPQIKSALVSTAGPAWENTLRTAEASVLLAGGGLVNVQSADDPKIFTEPASLSFGDLNVNGGARKRTLLLSVSDAGGGFGTWTVEVRPQSASSGAGLSAPGSVVVGPGGITDVAISATATAQAAAGDNYGFLALRRGTTTRRVPYAFFVTRPGLESYQARAGMLRRQFGGNTINGPDRVNVYRWPSAPFGHPPDYAAGAPVFENGAEKLYLVPHVARPVVNLGVAVVAGTRGSVVNPWLLGSPDENDVQGQAATPVNVNALTPDYRLPVGAAAAVFPSLKRFWVAVDSSRDEYTGRSLRGRYVLRYWVNDLRPPSVSVVTSRVAAGRPTIVLRVVDRGASVNPYSLLLSYRRGIVAASAYDVSSGLALFVLPGSAPRLNRGRLPALVMASDYQESKNVSTFGRNIMPNTRFRSLALRVVRGTTIDWLLPNRGACVRGSVPLLVVAGSTRRISSVRFFDGRRRIGADRSGTGGLYSATWTARRAQRGRHVLRAVVTTRGGRPVSVSRRVRVCR
ncbi:MAG: S8 family serine peptidase [Actinobacteria bacterium]|nr:S8 family serine peptidase [Actinomycetota bacterium]